AAQAVMTESPQEVLNAWEVLRAQHLLQDAGELRYQLHAIVGEYARNHFDENNDGANRQALQEAHANAAAYYLQVARNCPPREKRRSVKDVLPLIEGIWQFCQAGRWKD